MKIGLLECDHVLESFRHTAGDYREMFGALFAHHAPQVALQAFDVCNGAFPLSLDACDAYMATGSRFSAYDDLDQPTDESVVAKWIVEFLEGRKL